MLWKVNGKKPTECVLVDKKGCRRAIGGPTASKQGENEILVFAISAAGGGCSSSWSEHRQNHG